MQNAVKKMDAKSLILLRKVWAMRTSSHDGEVANAEGLAVQLVQRFGFQAEDIERLIREDLPATEWDLWIRTPEGRAQLDAYARDKILFDPEKHENIEAAIIRKIRVRSCSEWIPWHS